MSGSVHHLAGGTAAPDPSGVCSSSWRQPHTGQRLPFETVTGAQTCVFWRYRCLTVLFFCASDARWTDHPVWAWRGLSAGAAGEADRVQHSAAGGWSKMFCSFDWTLLFHLPPVGQIAVSHDGQIQYLPVRSKQQIVNPEDLEAAAHSAVTGGHLSCFIFSILQSIK